MIMKLNIKSTKICRNTLAAHTIFSLTKHRDYTRLSKIEALSCVFKENSIVRI